MMKQTTKQEFIFKTAFAMIFAIETGASVFSNVGQPGQLLRPWISGFLYTFFHFSCIVIMQWLLLSDHLPKGWIKLGFVGCTIAAIISGFIYEVIPFEAYFSYDFEIKILNAFVSGTLLALPQILFLKSKKGYLWILANGVGWAIKLIGRETIYSHTTYYDFFPLFKILFVELPIIPLGLFLGLYLYTYVYNPSHLQTNEGRSG